MRLSCPPARTAADATRAAELDPGNKAAAQLAAELRPVIAERQEKLKEEMVGANR